MAMDALRVIQGNDPPHGANGEEARFQLQFNRPTGQTAKKCHPGQRFTRPTGQLTAKRG